MATLGVLPEQVAERFLQLVQDARLGLAHGGGGHAQVRGDVHGGTAVDDGPPEHLPGALLELAADLVEGLSPAAVAEEMHTTPAAVRQAKSRVLRRLKQEMGEVLE